MAAELELQSILALTQASESLCQAPSPDRLLSPLSPHLPVLKPSLTPANRNLREMWKRLNVTSQSVDMGVQMLDPCRVKIAVSVLPVLKPSTLSLALKRKNKLPVPRDESETWLHPRVPRVLVHYLLEKQRKKAKEGWQPGRRKPFRIVSKAKILPSLNVTQAKRDFPCLHRSKSSVR
jgi:hypothetical protein